MISSEGMAVIDLEYLIPEKRTVGPRSFDAQTATGSS
jgi:hypothetical protein